MRSVRVGVPSSLNGVYNYNIHTYEPLLKTTMSLKD